MRGKNLSCLILIYIKGQLSYPVKINMELKVEYSNLLLLQIEWDI